MARLRTQPRIIVFASPKGGIGRSTCALVLARALAARDHEVLVVDISSFAGSASLFDLPNQNKQELGDLKPQKTSIKGISYACIQISSPEKLCSQLRDYSEFDDILIDQSNALDEGNFEIFLHADFPILIADPEPASIRLATLWLRLVFVYGAKRFEDNRDLCEFLIPQQERWSFQSVYPALQGPEQNRFISELSAFRCAFLLNNRRENSEDLQARALCHAWGMTLGLHIPYIGSIAFDERRWFFARQLADVSNFVHEDPIVREIDGIFKDGCEKIDFDFSECPPILDCESKAREFLWANSSEEARQMYRLLWEGYRRENGLVSNILSKEDIVHVISQLEIAYRHSEMVIQEVVPTSAPHVESPAMTRAFSTTLSVVQDPHSGKCKNPDAGIWMAQQRECKGLSMAQLSLKSRIPSKVIENIELCELQTISTPRLQAYLFEISKVLDIDFAETKVRFGLSEEIPSKSESK